MKHSLLANVSIEEVRNRVIAEDKKRGVVYSTRWYKHLRNKEEWNAIGFLVEKRRRVNIAANNLLCEVFGINNSVEESKKKIEARNNRILEKLATGAYK